MLKTKTQQGYTKSLAGKLEFDFVFFFSLNSVFIIITLSLFHYLFIYFFHLFLLVGG